MLSPSAAAMAAAKVVLRLHTDDVAVVVVVVRTLSSRLYLKLLSCITHTSREETTNYHRPLPVSHFTSAIPSDWLLAALIPHPHHW